MAVTFAQAAELVADPVRRGAIETAAAVSWVWDRMPFENIEGNSYSSLTVRNAVPGSTRSLS